MATHIVELTERIRIVDEMIASGEVAADDPGLARIVEPWRVELAQYQAQAAAEKAEREALLAEAGVIRHGVAVDEDGDSKTVWFVIRRGTTGWWPILESIGVPMRGSRCHNGDYDCCGRFFSNGAYVRAGKKVITVTVGYARDV